MNEEQAKEIRYWLDKCGDQKSEIVEVASVFYGHAPSFFVVRREKMFLINNILLQKIASYGAAVRYIDGMRIINGKCFHDCLIIA